MVNSGIRKSIVLLVLMFCKSCRNKLKGTWKCDGGTVEGLEFLTGDQVILSLRLLERTER